MVQTPQEYGTTPVGRLIMGSLTEKQTTDHANMPIPPDKQRFFIAVAIEQNAPGINELLGAIQQNAMAGFSNAPHIQQQIGMGLNATQFSWKIDAPNAMKVDRATGQQVPKWRNAENCYVLKLSTQLPIRTAEYLPGSNVPTDCGADKFYNGCFVQVALSHRANGKLDHTAGMFLSPNTVAFVAHGEPIVSGPSLDQQFQNGPGGYMPAGASQTPLAPQGGMQGGQAQQNPGMGQQNPGMGGQAQGGMPGGDQQQQMGNPQQQQNPGMGGQPQQGMGQPMGGMPGAAAPNAGGGMPGQPNNIGNMGTTSGGNPMGNGAGAGMQNGGNPASQTPAMGSPSNQPPGYSGYMGNGQ